MKLPRLAIENYQFTLIGFVLLIVMGVSSFLTMPRTEDPPITIPGAGIVVIYPGTSPADLEQLVADPIEEEINELDNIKKINTTLKDGIASISVEFEFNTDADEKYDEVVRQVDNVKEELPEDIYSIDISQWTSTDVCMLQLAFVSDTAPYLRLNYQAEQLKKELEKIKGVKKVEIFAYPEEEIRIALDIEKMAEMNIAVDQVAGAIQSNNENIPGGALKMGNGNFSIKTSSRYDNIEEIRKTVVSFNKGNVVYLQDIADVFFTHEDQNYYARYNGHKSIFLTVQQKEGLNIFSIWEKLEKKIKVFEQALDQDIQLKVVFNQTDSVDDRINNFLGNLLQGILLVGAVIFLSLGFRSSIIVILAIPFSIFIGLGFVDLTGYGLQQISIAALVIALGLLVDNSIVIVENIERLIKTGMERKEAAVKATQQLGWPIISATVTTLFAFIPIIMMPDKAGKFIESMPVTVVFTLLASLLIALTLNPFISSLFLRNYKQKTIRQEKKKLSNYLQVIINGPYRKILSRALHNKEIVLITAFIALLLALLLFVTSVGVSFFPKAEKPQFMIHVNTPEGSHIEHTREAAKYVESVLDTIEEVKYYATSVGHGNPRIYYNQFPKQFAQNHATLFVQLTHYDYDMFRELFGSLRSIFSHYSKASIEVKELEQGPPIQAPLVVKITGKNNDVLKVIADSTEEVFRNTPGVININNELSKTKTDLYVNINKDKAGMLGVPVSSIDKTIRACINGQEVSKFRDDKGNEYDIVIRLPFNDKLKLSDFDKIYVKSLAGKHIPLKQLASIEFRQSPGIVTHYNLEKCATVTADIASGYTLDDIIAKIRPVLDRYEWPTGYEYKFTGELESRKETFGGMERASLIALIAILAVLVLQFRSFKQPLIIFSAIPLALIGSICALYVTGYTFSFTAFIGLISLIGIVVNNSIILVDYSNRLLAEGKSLDNAVKEAGMTRFTPIVLTTLTTIGGLLPLTLRGGTLWAPMGWTIIGGLLVSTILTLIVVPVLYHMLSKGKVMRN